MSLPLGELNNKKKEQNIEAVFCPTPNNKSLASNHLQHKIN
jgi:hypothetical protein